MSGAAAPPVIAIFGPTAVGKTAVAVELAGVLRERGEDPVAVSADALQVYRGLEALTGAPGPGELARLEHRLLAFLDPSDTFSVGEFMPLAHAEIDRARADGRRPIVVGGTGLYLRAALTELSLAPPPPPQLRARLEEAVAARGPAAMHAELRTRAPAAAAAIEPTDRTRIVRSLELLELGAEPPATAGSELWSEDTRVPTRLLASPWSARRCTRGSTRAWTPSSRRAAPPRPGGPTAQVPRGPRAPRSASRSCSPAT